jgi:hypothetical protein
MRKRKLLVVLAGLAVVVAVGVVVLCLQPSRITRDNFDCIHHGMTRAEVEVIPGPPGDYTTGPYLTGFRPMTISTTTARGSAVGPSGPTTTRISSSGTTPPVR